MTNPFKALAQKISSLASKVPHEVADLVEASAQRVENKLKWEFYQETAQNAISRMSTIRPENAERLSQALALISQD